MNEKSNKNRIAETEERVLDGRPTPRRSKNYNGDGEILPNNLDDKTRDANGLSPGMAYFRLWTYAGPADILLRVIGTVAILAAGTALPLMTIVFGAFVNTFNGWATGETSPDEFREAVDKNALYLVYLFIGRITMCYLGSMLYNATASSITRKIRLRYVDTVIKQPISYFDRHSTGSITSDLTSDVNQIELGLGEKVAVVFLGSSMVITAFTIALTKSWKLALACMTIVPWTLTITSTLASIDTKLEYSIKGIYSDASTLVEEALSSIANITALEAEDKIVARYKEYVHKALKNVAIRGSLWAVIFGNMFFSTHAAYALCLFYGVKLVRQGDIPDGGTVLIVMFCCILGSSSLGLIAPGIPEFIKAGVAAQRILHLMEQTGRTDENNDGNQKGIASDSVQGNIQISDVSFAYPTRPSIPVLNRVNLDVPAGKITAVVGTSGSGKSTLIALLERWYSLEQGRITLDGEDMKNYSVSSWRSIMGLVQQEPMLFDDTILQNILNGYHGANCTGLSQSEKERLVVEAAKKANAHEFISQLPDGYLTRVGQRADRLSGGQKQRIAIARAIVSNPKILLLDEATSALDSESEKTVQAAIDCAARGRTTIQISHNLATVRGAHRIVVMDQGRVVEEGSHKGLLKVDGLYSRLIRAQTYLDRNADDLEVKENSAPEVTLEVALGERKMTGEAKLPPSIASEEVTRKHGVLWGLGRLVKAYPRMALPMFVGLVLSLGIAATFPLTAFLYSKLVTVFQLQGRPEFQERSNFWALMFFIMGIVELFLYFSVFYLLGVAGVIAGKRYRPDLLQGMLKQDSVFFQAAEDHSAGGLLALLLNDGEALEMLVASNMPIFFYNMVNVLACAILGPAIYWKLGLVCTLGCLPLAVGMGLVRMRMDNRARGRCESFFLESARFVAESIGSVRTVASLGLEMEVVRRYNAKLDAAVTRSTRAALVYFVFYALSDSMDLLLMALIFWYGGRLVSFGELSPGDFFIIYTAVLFGGQAAGFAFGYSADLAKARSALNRLFYLIDSVPIINGTRRSRTSPPRIDQPVDKDIVIEFRNVYFRYPSRPNMPVLSGLNLKIRKGENVCLVGRSGCGKSTVLSLMERFYDPTSGSILIQNQPLSSLDILAHRARLALVSQETTLYQGTIRDNVLLGVSQNHKVTEEAMMDACRQANIHDFITSLPSGYDTDCGPRGLALSGGQRQRIAIARALLRGPEVLLLDEATSALDAESEGLVREALERAGRGRTMVAAAHQVEAMRRADRVVVIEGGRVVEEGPFEDLIQTRGALWRLMRDVMQH